MADNNDTRTDELRHEIARRAFRAWLRDNGRTDADMAEVPQTQGDGPSVWFVAADAALEVLAAPSRPPVAPSKGGWPTVPDLPLGERATAALGDDSRPPVADNPLPTNFRKILMQVLQQAYDAGRNDDGPQELQDMADRFRSGRPATQVADNAQLRDLTETVATALMTAERDEAGLLDEIARDAEAVAERLIEDGWHKTPVADNDHLRPIVSDRGFSHLPEIPGAYGGHARVYESSAADGPHLWLHTTSPNPEREVSLHLTAENAWKLREQLDHLLANHYQGDARPAETEGA